MKQTLNFLKRRVSFRSKIEIKAVSYQSIFDLATSIDKLVSSSAFTGNEIRLEVGYEISDDPNLNTHHITKNYTKLTESEGGENTNDGEN